MLEMIEFIIPDSKNLTPRNIKFLDLIKQHPEMFYDDFKIVSAYGCPEGSIWNGGRYNPGQYSINMVKEMLNAYKKYNVNYSFTFTNLLLENHHLLDTYSNMIAAVGNIEGNNVISATPVMTTYIKDNYKNYSIVESITQKLNFEELNNRSRDKITVLPVEFNKNFEALEKFTYPENLVLLVNEPCVDNCPYKKAHYIHSSKMNLFMTNDLFSCKSRVVPGQKLWEEVDAQNHSIHREDLRYYTYMGINKFKISGRCDNQKVSLHTMLNLMVKDEYKDFVEKEVTNIKREDWSWDWVSMFGGAI